MTDPAGTATVDEPGDQPDLQWVMGPKLLLLLAVFTLVNVGRARCTWSARGPDAPSPS